MKTKEEIREGIGANCVNHEGDIDISGLDFTDFRGSVHRGGGKVKRYLYQGRNEVGGELYQNENKVKGGLGQGGNEVGHNLTQNYNKVEKQLGQNRNKVKGNLVQCGNKVGSDLHQDCNEVKGKTFNDFKKHNKIMKKVEGQGGVEDERFAKQLEDMTREELMEIIKEMRKQNENK